jgi:NAD(P)-dependent dehydrogenase (short-subunit alcohol dehydrogenase family)
MPLFDGKVVMVTGGSSGVGQAACHLYAREGAKVVVSDVDEKGGQETVQAIQEGKGEATFIRADVSNPSDCQALVDSTLEEYRRLDIAFKNTVIGGEANLTADYSIEGRQKVIGTNLSGIHINSVGPGFIRTPLIDGLEQNKLSATLLVARR